MISMSVNRTIGQLAKAAGVPTSTVRYYERRGLLRPQTRSAGNYRVYDENALDRLGFMRAAQAAGFTLADIGLLLRYRDGDPSPCQKVQSLVKARLVHVAEQVEHLQTVDRVLRRWLKACRDTQGTSKCSLLDGLVSRTNGCCQPIGDRKKRA